MAIVRSLTVTEYTPIRALGICPEGSAMSAVLRWLRANLSSEIFGPTASWAWPGVASAMTFAVGLVQVPVAYALAACFLVFACASFGALSFHKLVFQRSPAFKLVPVQPQMGIRADEGIVKGIKLGIILNNSECFRLNIRPLNYAALLMGADCPEDSAQPRQYSLPEHSKHLLGFRGRGINQSGESYRMSLHISISYGKPGRLAHDLEGR